MVTFWRGIDFFGCGTLAFWALVVEKKILVIWVWSWEFFFDMRVWLWEIFAWEKVLSCVLGHGIFFAWASLSPNIQNIITEASFGTFFEALSSHEAYEYKDLQLLLALAERFWDTTCTFRFPGIKEVMLTPYDFSIIIGLRLGDKRILVNDSFSSSKLKKL